ncbi:hypothetical protein N7492_006035 [Penicillium capsulatum]|uniref:Uncharacterized protein n=1 Tax=Penicillium capsulatum TaxID=69766 RepID=A0A9W9LRQ0_9EURO|nr:hypothetical protein N7492_006035 [Penicillium capsulatum]
MTDHTPQENVESEDLGLPPRIASDSECLVSGRPLLGADHDDSNQPSASRVPNKPEVRLPRISPSDYGPRARGETEASKQSSPWPHPVGLSSTLLSALLNHLEGDSVSPSLELRAKISTSPPSPSIYEDISAQGDAATRESSPYAQSPRGKDINTSPEESYEQIIETFLLDISFEDSSAHEQGSSDDLSTDSHQSNVDPVASAICVVPRPRATPTSVSTPSFPLAGSHSAPPETYQARRRKSFTTRLKTRITHAFKARREANL